jgi:hypothetical protein
VAKHKRNLNAWAPFAGKGADSRTTRYVCSNCNVKVTHELSFVYVPESADRWYAPRASYMAVCVPCATAANKEKRSSHDD